MPSPKPMTKEEHQARHVALHVNLDELFSDYITNSGGRTSDTIMSMISWSHRQTLHPDHESNT